MCVCQRRIATVMMFNVNASCLHVMRLTAQFNDPLTVGKRRHDSRHVSIQQSTDSSDNICQSVYILSFNGPLSPHVS